MQRSRKLKRFVKFVMLDYHRNFSRRIPSHFGDRTNPNPPPEGSLFYFFISKFLSLVSFFRVRLSVTVRVGVNSSSNPNPKFQSFLGNLILEYPV